MEDARQVEIGYIRKHGVYKKVKRSTVPGGVKIIKVRWIDINKGDDLHPNYRSRLVGKEFNNEAMDGIFAGTPPLEALQDLDGPHAHTPRHTLPAHDAC